jgi:acyl dehydratase
MDLAQLVDQAFGPHLLRVSVDRITDFVEVTGDDPDRWVDAAPPGFAAAALFVVAPDLLGQLTDHSVIHGEQTFTWHEPIDKASLLEVKGTVTRSRERGGVHFVSFDLVATTDERPVLEGSSLFLISGEAIPGQADFERPEPPQAYRGELEQTQVAASRADLIRYAAATRDWNPIHWDHDAAVAAGLPGVVVHGLFQAAWAFEAVTRQVDGQRPLLSAKVRFRNPLLPARPVSVDIEHEDSVFEVTIAGEETTYLTARIEADVE